MEQQPQVYVDPHAGKVVNYVDERGQPHKALVTICHGGNLGRDAINIVYVSSDATQRDPYGRQIVRQSSVSAQSEYTAHGRYYTVPE